MKTIACIIYQNVEIIILLEKICVTTCYWCSWNSVSWFIC